jgi:hypothetical protein
MDYRVIYTTEDGGVAVVVPTPDSGLTTGEVIARSVPQGIPYEIVDKAAIPSDRLFRNAWERNGKVVEHSITKCKTVAHEIRRNKRAAEFAPLDIEATIPSKAAQAEAARQALRDKYATIQDNINNAVGVETLKQIVKAL